MPLLVRVMLGCPCCGVASAEGLAAPHADDVAIAAATSSACHTRIPASPRLAADTLAGWFWREA